jgi:hypothetical protein
MMRGTFRFGALFFGSAVLAFAMLLSLPASSSTRNIAGASCQSSRSSTFPYPASYWCSVVTDDTTYTTSTLTGGFFDFSCPASGYTVQYQFSKYSYTGTFYADIASYACSAVGAHDLFLTASNVKLNASTDDYLYTVVTNVFEEFGVQAQFSP